MSVAEPIQPSGLIAEGDEPRFRLTRLRQPMSDPKDIYVPISKSFTLASHEPLPDPHIRIRRYGRRNAPPILVMGGISAGRKLTGQDGWWNDIVGPNQAIDLQNHSAL